MNRFPHFRDEIEGIGIHFLHEQSTNPNAIPLLMIHGWPSSFVQMLDILPMMTNSDSHPRTQQISFNPVVVSLPGYGFSDRPTQPGMNVMRIGELLHQLMTVELGYSRFGIRGSDLGAGVLSQIALSHPESIIGVHTGGTNPWIAQIPDDLTTEEKTFVEEATRWNRSEMAYAMEHSSKPTTLAAALNDSPAGMAAWILEKFWRWSDCGGNLENRFTRDDLLINLTIYWATETIGSSIRLYYETMRDPGHWGIADVPTAMLMSPKDMFPTPRSWAERISRIDRWTELNEGGHFLEWEVPELVAEDLRIFFGSLV